VNSFGSRFFVYLGMDIEIESDKLSKIFRIKKHYFFTTDTICEKIALMSARKQE